MVQMKQSDRQDLACASPVFNLCCDTVDAQLVFSNTLSYYSSSEQKQDYGLSCLVSKNHLNALSKREDSVVYSSEFTANL